jgi:uncharacterized phage-associated protein
MYKLTVLVLFITGRNRKEGVMLNQKYSAIAIANAFIDRAGEERQGLSPMKIQKLVYFAHAWKLALANKPLIEDPVKAWKFGPVIDSVYHEFKKFGNSDITSYGTLYEGFSYIVPKVDSADLDTIALVERIRAVYREYDAIELSNMTHEPGTPWYTTLKEHDGGVTVIRRGSSSSS